MTAGDGVRDVIYCFYLHVPRGGIGGSYPNVLLDCAYPRAQARCDEALSFGA